MRLARWIGIVVVIAIIAAVVLRPQPEPTYQGRSLSSWLRQATEPPRHAKLLGEARDAIRAIGAERTIPVLLRLINLNGKQTTLRDMVQDIGREMNLIVGPMWQSNDSSTMATAGFDALGSNAVSAIPALTKLTKDPIRSGIALRCLAAIGPSARKPVLDALTVADAKTRGAAIWSLPQVIAEPNEIINTLTNSLRDSDMGVRDASIHVIGAQVKAPERALPLLIDLVRNGDTNDAAMAAMQIQNFGTNALFCVETLSNVVHEAPYSPTALAAMRSMMVIAPEQALPILFRQLHSVDPGLRSRALSLLVREFPKPEIAVPAVEYAAQDPEEFIAYRAERFLEWARMPKPVGLSPLPQ